MEYNDVCGIKCKKCNLRHKKEYDCTPIENACEWPMEDKESIELRLEEYIEWLSQRLSIKKREREVMNSEYNTLINYIEEEIWELEKLINK